MKKHQYTWQQIEACLTAMPAPEPGPPEAFWERFKARAAMVPQDGAESPSAKPAPLLGFVGLQRLAALAATLMVAGALTVVILRGGSVARGAGSASEVVGRGLVGQNQVQSVEVMAPNSGVMIMGDEQSSGTVVWIAGLQLPGAGEERR